MDSISQALWGALSSEAVTTQNRKLRVKPWLIGLVGGTLPDLDSFFFKHNRPPFLNPHASPFYSFNFFYTSRCLDLLAAFLAIF